MSISTMLANTSGKCGTLSWAFNSSTGELTISGMGSIPDYNKKKEYSKSSGYIGNYYTEAPWSSIKDEITSVAIENGCTAVGDYAFSSCKNLQSVTLPNSLKQIGEYAFAYCENIESIIIPEQISVIKNHAFDNCHNLSSVIWNARNCKIPSYWADCPFANTKSKIIRFVFGNNVDVIPSYLCYGLQHITSISIPKSVRKIGNSAFGKCDTISNVYISDLSAWMNIDFESVSSNPARNRHFYLNGKELRDVLIPSNVTKLKDFVFEGIKIESITFNHVLDNISPKAFSQDKISVTWNVKEPVNKKKSGQSPIYNLRNKITKIHFGENVDHISSYLCSDFENLQTVTTSNNIKSIGEGAFFRCCALESVSLNNGIKTIGEGAFNGCISLKSINIPPTITTIKNAAFYSCYALNAVYISNLEMWCRIDFGGYSSNPIYYAHNLYLEGEKVLNLIIPESIKEIKSHAFENFAALENVVVNEGCTQIGDYAFAGGVNLKSVKLPSSMTTINEYAFARCGRIESIVLPEKIEYIGDDAFWLCSKMNLSSLPKSIKYIGNHAFCGCVGIKNIHIPASILKIEKNAFDDVFNIEYNGTDKYAPWLAKSLNGCIEGDFAYKDAKKTTLVACFQAVSDTIKIPKGVTKIGDRAFYACNKLTHIIMPDGVKRIGKLAFARCRGLQTINIPESVIEIGEKAFLDCSNLQEITIPSNVTSIGSLAFFGCRNMKSFNVEVANKQYSSREGVLFNKTQTALIQYPAGRKNQNYIIPNGAKYVLEDAFFGNKTLQSITLPKSLLSIGDEAFWGCISLSEIQFPAKLETIGKSAFELCPSLESVIIPSSVTRIGMRAFYQCNGLKLIDIKGGDTKIEDYAFFQCENAIRCTIPNQITQIGKEAFEDVPTLTYLGRAKGSPWGARSLNGWIKGDTIYSKNKKGEEIKIRRDLNWSSKYNKEPIFHHSHNGDKLYECSLNAEGEIIVPDGVEIICEYAFQNCGKITSVVIPNSVTTIESRAFNACSALKNVNLGRDITRIEDNAFSGCLSLEKIIIPESVRYLGENVFSDCYNLREIIIEKNAENFHCEQNAFDFCHALQSIAIPQNTDILRSIPKGTDIVRFSTDSSNLELVPKTLIAHDSNQNGIVEADEPCNLRFRLYNSGKGNAVGLRALCMVDKNYPFLHVQEETLINNIPSGAYLDIDIPFYTDTTASIAKIPLFLSIIENQGNGLKCPPITIETNSYQKPRIGMNYTIHSGSNVAEKTNPLIYKMYVCNTGKGLARDVKCNIQLPSSLQLLSGDLQHTWDVIDAGERKEFSIKLTSNEKSHDSLSVDYILKEKYGQYSQSGYIPLVFGKTPTYKITSTEDNALSIAGNSGIKMLTNTSVSILRPEWFNRYNNLQNIKSPFPYATIKLELKGSKDAIDVAKERLSLMMGGKHIVEVKDTKETNTIWFLVHCRNEYIDLDCGDGCEPINIRKERLEPNRVYTGEVYVAIP